MTHARHAYNSQVSTLPVTDGGVSTVGVLTPSTDRRRFPTAHDGQGLNPCPLWTVENSTRGVRTAHRRGPSAVSRSALTSGSQRTRLPRVVANAARHKNEGEPMPIGALVAVFVTLFVTFVALFVARRRR